VFKQNLKNLKKYCFFAEKSASHPLGENFANFVLQSVNFSFSVHIYLDHAVCRALRPSVLDLLFGNWDLFRISRFVFRIWLRLCRAAFSVLEQKDHLTTARHSRMLGFLPC